jgi:DNA-binding NarL/FixJ family response regulator
MPGMSGIEVAYKVRGASPETRVLVYSMDAHRETVLSLFNAGIAGYVLKDESMDTLLNALKAVAEGKVYFSVAVVGILWEFHECGGIGRVQKRTEMDWHC